MSTDAPTVDQAGLAERERVLSILRAREPELRAQGITRLRLYGSMARAEAGPESDIDLIAEIADGSGFSLRDHVGLQQELSKVFGRSVDIAAAPWKMRPRMRQRVEADAIEVF